MDFLRTSAAGFDGGVEAEAKRLAVQIRVLVHDASGNRKGRSVSLLTQIGVRDRLPWLDTAIVPDPTWVDFGLGLCRLAGEGKGSDLRFFYAPPLGDLGPDRLHAPASFVDWWTQPILADRMGHTFSRANFIDRVANQDGGAHVDARLDESYEALTRGNSMRIAAGKGMLGFNIGSNLTEDPGPPGSSIALASVRQIAYEVLRTVDDGLETQSNGEFRIVSPICPLPIESKCDLGRNDPCPCGSGAKVKKCFALREPRNPRVTQTGAIAMA
jgi:hypothetical protein